jgi:hypothetical protein
MEAQIRMIVKKCQTVAHHKSIYYLDMTKTKKIRKSFSWSNKSCNRSYFKSLKNALNKVQIPKNTGEYIRPRFTRKYKYCKQLKIKDCKLDRFHSGDKYLQIILGRWPITSNCFTECKNYFAMAMNKWSFFKNDIFIHKLIDNNYFYSKYNELPLDPIFPIRVVLSNDYLIPDHRMKKTMNFIKDYGYDYFKGRAISDRMEGIILKKYPELTTKITKTLPLSHVISRELCILNENNLYFYKIKIENVKRYEPYVFISERNIEYIRNHFKDQPVTIEYL